MERLIGIDDPVMVLAVAVDLLSSHKTAVAATTVADLPALVRIGARETQHVHLSGSDTQSIKRLVPGRAAIAELIDRQRCVGFLAVDGPDRRLLDAIAPAVARALGLALRIREERAEHRA